MKNIIISIIISCLCYTNLQAQTNNDKNSRWDKELIEEAPIWKNLLVNYANADYEKYWPERKTALEEIVSNYPLSNWADDAKLLLAGGKAHIENDISGAIKDLRAIIEEYPNEVTIVESWSINIGFRLSEAWLMWAPGLISYDDKGKVKKTHPFDSDKIIRTYEQEVLYYFKHLKKCNTYTKDIAQFTIALLLIEQGDKEGAIVELENFIAKNSNFSEITKCDFNASKGKNGFLVESVPPFMLAPINRVQYKAVALLCELYLEYNDEDKAFNLLATFANESCSEGWLWNYNLFCCELFIRMGKPDLAEKQLDIAEEGLTFKIERSAKRFNKLYDEGNLIVSSDFIDWETTAKQEYTPIFLQINNLREKIKSGF